MVINMELMTNSFTNSEFEILRTLVGNKFDLAGSRLILPFEAKEHTDYDYIGVDNDYSRDWLSVLGFKQMLINSSYLGEDTTSIWIRKNFPIQIVLKDKMHVWRVYEFWKEMKKDPSIFREYFWKSNPHGKNTHDVIHARIDAYIHGMTILEATSGA